MWLEVLTGEDAGRVVELPEGRAFVVGRVQGADLVVRDARASRMHAELTAEGGALAAARPRLRERDARRRRAGEDGDRCATASGSRSGTSPSRSWRASPR